MGFLDRLFGADEQEAVPAAPQRRRPPNEDERAVERYRYLLQTAPPETIEQVHAEAFSKLSEQQRALVYEELSRGSGTGERPLSSEPATLARAATRKEMREPGSLERSLGGQGMGGPSFGSMLGASLLGTVAGYVVGSALVSAFLPWDGGYGGNEASGDSGSGSEGDASADAGGDYGSDFGGDFGGGDFGGDFGF